MSEIGNDPAYPVVADNGVAFAASFRGLTKREAFAMAAMQGMAMRCRDILDHEVAAASVRMADALLAALKE